MLFFEYAQDSFLSYGLYFQQLEIISKKDFSGIGEVYNFFQFKFIFNCIKYLLLISDWRWLSFYVLILGLPFIQSFYLILSALYLFIPIMGRSGAGNNSEIIIAVMSGILFSLLTSFVSPLILLIKRPGKIVSVFLGVFLISIGILLLTPFGFPYSGDPQSPAPQRFMIAVSTCNTLVLLLLLTINFIRIQKEYFMIHQIIHYQVLDIGLLILTLIVRILLIT